MVKTLIAIKITINSFRSRLDNGKLENIGMALPPQILNTLPETIFSFLNLTTAKYTL